MARISVTELNLGAILVIDAGVDALDYEARGLVWVCGRVGCM